MTSYEFNFNESLSSVILKNDSTETSSTFNESSLEDVCKNFHVNQHDDEDEEHLFLLIIPSSDLTISLFFFPF